MRNTGGRPGRTGKLGKQPRRYAIPGARFREARFAAGLSVADTAKLLRVTARTVQHWESGGHRIPYAAYKLLRILRGSHYLQHPTWRDWRVQGDSLYTPEGHRIHAGEMGWWSLLVRQAREYQAIIRGRRVAVVTPPQPPAEGVPRPPPEAAALGLSLLPTSRKWLEPKPAPQYQSSLRSAPIPATLGIAGDGLAGWSGVPLPSSPGHASGRPAPAFLLIGGEAREGGAL
jgi:transcriptional regulator with XRE-family HTH domain